MMANCPKTPRLHKGGNKVENKDCIVEQLTGLIEKGKQIAASSDSYGHVDQARVNAWRAEILTIVRYAKLDVPEYVDQINNEGNRYRRQVLAMVSTLDTMIEQVKKGILRRAEPVTNPDAELENVFNKFHKVARQLRTRHDSRSTLKISDEYDVQDLLHALLLLQFDDVRPEEWTPSYAGGSVRMDFLLKDEGIVIEVKKTRTSMAAKSLGEELIIDREKYKVHPDCRKLYCFVYDPEGLLGNPNGIKKDLESNSEDFIKVFIRPE